MIEPRHALGCRAPRSGGNHNFEAAEVAARVGVLAAVVEPQNAEGQNAVDVDADSPSPTPITASAALPLSSRPRDIGGTEAVLEIHGRAQAVDFGADELAREHALQQALIIAARGVAGSGSAAVAGGHKLQRLRLGRAHAARHQPQHCARSFTSTTVRTRLRSSLHSSSRQRPCDSLTE